jgi:Na+/proline symporter
MKYPSVYSTMSSTLNSLGATLFEDFVRPCLNIKVSDKTSNNVIKLLVVITGAVCVLMVFFVDKVGGIIQVGILR